LQEAEDFRQQPFPKSFWSWSKRRKKKHWIQQPCRN